MDGCESIIVIVSATKNRNPDPKIVNIGIGRSVDPIENKAIVAIGFYTGGASQEHTDNVRLWSQDKDLFIYDKVSVPIQIGNSRFILVVIFIQEKRIQIYDRVQSDDAAKFRAILFCYIKKEYLLLYEKYIIPLMRILPLDGPLNLIHRII